MEKIILIHGYTETPAIWKNMDVSNAYADTFILVDANDNFGRKDRISDVAEEILDSCSAQDRLVLIGHSMGGYIALEMLHLDPKRVRALMLMQSHPNEDSAPKKEQRMQSLALIDEMGKDAFLRRTIPGLFLKDVDRAHVESNIQAAKSIPKTAIENELKAMAHRKDHSELYAKSDILKGLYLGAQDPMVNYADLLEFAAEIDNLCLYLDEKSGHMAYAENPVKMRNSMQDFLATCARQL